MEDIRIKSSLRNEDIRSLNFIREQNAFIFRRHYRSGLRSHIMEMLWTKDLNNEIHGVGKDGIRWFPRARPLKMLRIFRRYFKNLKQAIEEIDRFHILVNYLTPKHLAMSEEFLVDYIVQQKRDILLCGLQEYVDGENLDPWTRIRSGYIGYLADRLLTTRNGSEAFTKEQLMVNIRSNTESFVNRIKTMIVEKRYIPDLAGVRNVLVTGNGQIKLVDINNISFVSFNECIITDDIGYPVCDKSIEALALIEKIILNKKINTRDPFYARLFQSGRQSEIERLHRRFHQSVQTKGSFF